MNKLIKKQLDKVIVTKVKYDTSDVHIVIPKVTKLQPSIMQVGQYYAITLSDTLLSMPTNSTLATNWNNGVIPQAKKYAVEIVDKMNNMLKVNGAPLGVSAKNFFGWIPLEYIESVDSKL